MIDTKKRSLLLLMDGHAMVYRAWHAIQQPLNISRTGEDVRAVFGFLNSFLRSLSDWQPTHCAIAFDLPGPTFRHQEYDQYKAHRPPMPPELRSQIDRVRELMTVFGIPIFQQKEYEADDVLGTLCFQAENQQLDTLVLTGDTDELQLVSPSVRVLLSYGSQGKTLYDMAKVKERYGGLNPNVIPDIKALQGDTSDNIPGVPGIGAKTAIKLLLKYNSLENIFDQLNTVTPPKTQLNLRNHRNQALQGKFLATIVRDVPLKLDLEESRFWDYDRSKIVAAFSELEFFSMISRIPESTKDLPMENPKKQLVNSTPNKTYEVVDTVEALEAMVEKLNTPDGFSFDTETTSLNPMSANLVGISFSKSTNKGWYIPIGHRQGKQIPLDSVLVNLRAILENQQIPKSAHNANYDLMVLGINGVQVQNLAFDTMLAAHISGRKSIGLKALALECLKMEMEPITNLIGTGRKQITMAEVPIEKAAQYSSADADVTNQLHAILHKEIEANGLEEVLRDIELPLVPVLVKMQTNGVSLDTSLLQNMSYDLDNQVSRLRRTIYDVIGHEFNISSSQQLGDVLFKELHLPHTKRTKTGYSTDASALEWLKTVLYSGKYDECDPRSMEIINAILEYRQLTKIKSTYVDTLPSLVHKKTGRIHTSYNQTGSTTGRVSSNDPNVQNIPVRTELGRRVRDAFRAEKPSWTLMSADYSQIELRVLAHLSGDPGLLTAFQTCQDIHAVTASSVYGVPISQIDPDMRRIAKIMNFGVIYGLSAFGISQQTGLTPDQGKEFINTYFGKYPGIPDYITSIKKSVTKHGYVETLLGRRRYIPEVQSSNFHVRSAGERMAINMPIQGTAADIIKIAMIRIQEQLDKLKLKSMMIIQVHDELIFEVPENELEQMELLITEIMSSALKLKVPLDIDLKSGRTWGTMK